MGKHEYIQEEIYVDAVNWWARLWHGPGVLVKGYIYNLFKGICVNGWVWARDYTSKKEFDDAVSIMKKRVILAVKVQASQNLSPNAEFKVAQAMGWDSEDKLPKDMKMYTYVPYFGWD